MGDGSLRVVRQQWIILDEPLLSFFSCSLALWSPGIEESPWDGDDLAVIRRNDDVLNGYPEFSRRRCDGGNASRENIGLFEHRHTGGSIRVRGQVRAVRSSSVN